MEFVEGSRGWMGDRQALKSSPGGKSMEDLHEWNAAHNNSAALTSAEGKSKILGPDVNSVTLASQRKARLELQRPDVAMSKFCPARNSEHSLPRQLLVDEGDARWPKSARPSASAGSKFGPRRNSERSSLLTAAPKIANGASEPSRTSGLGGSERSKLGPWVNSEHSSLNVVAPEIARGASQAKLAREVAIAGGSKLGPRVNSEHSILSACGQSIVSGARGLTLASQSAGGRSKFGPESKFKRPPSSGALAVRVRPSLLQLKSSCCVAW